MRVVIRALAMLIGAALVVAYVAGASYLIGYFFTLGSDAVSDDAPACVSPEIWRRA